MKITLKNIGKIKNAEVLIDGITVIAGENNTGKSTVGKALWSVFNALHDIDKRINDNKVYEVRSFLRRYLSAELIGGKIRRSEGMQMIDDAAEKIVDLVGPENRDRGDIRSVFSDILRKINPDFDFENMIDRANMAYDDLLNILIRNRKDSIVYFLTETFNAEFNEDMLSVYTPALEEDGRVVLDIKGNRIDVGVADDLVWCDDNLQSLYSSVVYIDDPFVVDDIQDLGSFSGQIYSHRDDLCRKLSSETEYMSVLGVGQLKEKLKEISKILNGVCQGDITTDRYSIFYKIPNTDRKIDIRSISTGLKTFVIFKQLLEKRIIDVNGTIILDEPEVHLHPEWQLKLAEAIVLLHKELGLHILLNTHSPYFLEAIEVYGREYGVLTKTKFYLATNDDQGIATIEDVGKNTERIYALLAEPFNVLEGIKYHHD